MVSTTAHYSQSRYQATPGTGYDGVVRLSHAGFYSSGVLLFDGRAVLTAAHLFADKTRSTTVLFETSRGQQSLTASHFLSHPGHDNQGNNDLALVWLSSAAPSSADRYTLYRDTDEIGQVFSFSGYGRTGTGSVGVDTSSPNSPEALRLKASNQFDADGAQLKSFLGAAMLWTPQIGTQLVADFDNGLPTNDAFGRLMGRHDLGQGLAEGLIASGDSGGPAFINGQVAGIASYTANLNLGSIEPDIDTQPNSSFGEQAAWQRISAYQQWIDQNVRAHYPNAPTRAQDVKTQVTEGHSGASYAYFLLQFTGVRSDASLVLSVDYATRDGTAVAGSDYLTNGGRLNLYPGEDQAVIAVEILGDYQSEPDETFYLDVFNPVGGSFGPGVVTLTAMRTILNDDGWFA
jgi:hypothetical protein